MLNRVHATYNVVSSNYIIIYYVLIVYYTSQLQTYLQMYPNGQSKHVVALEWLAFWPVVCTYA